MGKRPFFPREVAAGRVPPATLGISLVLYFEGDAGAGGLQGARDERHVVVLTLGHLACVALVEVRALVVSRKVVYRPLSRIKTS